jgi:hypothetical protein
MTTETAIRSDFLVHWTGKDLDQKYDPGWFKKQKSEIRRDTNIARAYLERLENILTYGLWLTAEDQGSVRAGDVEIEIPSTPKVCFTELKLSESRVHARQYGRLAVGFKRPYLFRRGGRPLAYFGFHADTNSDPFLKACARDLKDQNLLNYFKPMNSSRHNLNYDYYSESEWRVLYSDNLLKEGRIIDPRNPANEKEHQFYLTLSEPQKQKLQYLMPLDGWFSLIIYPSFWVKNMAQQDLPSRIIDEIDRIKSTRDHGNRVEGGNWPMEIDLSACRHF